MDTGKLNRPGVQRRHFLAMGAALPLVLIGGPADAILFAPKLTAKDVGNKARVRVWLSANVGPVNLNNYSLGTYYVAYGQTIQRSIAIGTATVKISLSAKREKVKMVIKLLQATMQTQQKVIEAVVDS
jgi:hypothetical protein